KVLARLERSDREHVVAVRRRAVACERAVDSVRYHADLLFGNTKHVDELALRELRHGNHDLRAPKNARHDAWAVPARPAVEGVGMPEHREVVHRDDEWSGVDDGAAIRRTVEDVQSARAPRQRDRIPQRVTREVPRPRVAAEGELAHVDVVAAA